MAYQKTNWVNDETPLNAENMNKIESGIEQNANDVEALRDNTTQIVPTSGGLKLGGAISAETNGIAIGNEAKNLSLHSVALGKNAQSGFRSIAIGLNAKAGNSSPNNDHNIAIGLNAIANSYSCFQIGSGTNSTPNSFQIEDDNIYNHSTHTLTVQNIELNGVDLGTLLGDINTALEKILGV